MAIFIARSMAEVETPDDNAKEDSRRPYFIPPSADSVLEIAPASSEAAKYPLYLTKWRDETLEQEKIRSLRTHLLRYLRGIDVPSLQAAEPLALRLADTLLEEGLQALRRGYKPQDLKRGITQAAKHAIKRILAASQPMSIFDTYVLAGQRFAYNKVNLARVVTSAFRRVGPQGIVEVEGAQGEGLGLEFVKGLRFPQGYATPHFATSQLPEAVDAPRWRILLCDESISRPEDLWPVFEVARELKEPLLMITPDIDRNSLATLAFGNTEHTANVAVVRTTGSARQSQALFRDIAAVSGADISGPREWNKAREFDFSSLGTAARIVVRENTTTIIGGGGDSQSVDNRVTELKARAAESPAASRAHLEERIDQLERGVARITVGQESDFIGERRTRTAEDAVIALREAQVRGVVQDAATTAISGVSTGLEQLDASAEGEAAGFDALRRSLERSFDQPSPTAEDASVASPDAVLDGTFRPSSATSEALQQAATVTADVLANEMVFIGPQGELHGLAPHRNDDGLIAIDELPELSSPTPEMHEMHSVGMRDSSTVKLGNVVVAGDFNVVLAPGIESTETPAPPNKIIRRTPHMDLAASPPFSPGTTFTVAIYTSLDRPRKGEESEDVILDVPASLMELHLDVWLTSTRHFKIFAPQTRRLHVATEAQRDREPVRFKVQVRRDITSVDGAALIANFSYEGRPSGRVKRAIPLQIAVGGAQGNGGGADKGEARLSRGDEPPHIVFGTGAQNPDLTVTITDPEGSFQHLLCNVSSPHSLDEVSRNPMKWSVPTATGELVRGFMTDFIASTTPDSRLAALNGAGYQLWKIAPKNFKEAFWQLHTAGNLRTILIVSEEPFVPWELMIPTRNLRERSRELRPIGVDFVIGRWICDDNLAPAQQIRLSRSFVVAPTYTGPPAPENLVHARDEVTYVLKKIPGEEAVPTDFVTISGALTGGASDLVHFICHGADAIVPGQQALYLDDTTTLSSLQISGIFPDHRDQPGPFVFLNACEVGRPTVALRGVGGFANSFMEFGASGVVAPLWSVDDAVAYDVAQQFYDQVCKKAGWFAEVLRSIRSQAYESGVDTYAAYCFYGDPMAIRV